MEKVGPVPQRTSMGHVREDYSENGNAWDYFSHDQARSRAYHWGEDGSPESRTISNGSASRSRSGMGRTRFLRSACSDSQTARVITVRT